MRDFELNSNDDMIDVRDVIERYEELESEHEDLTTNLQEAQAELANDILKGIFITTEDREDSETVVEDAKKALENWKEENDSEFTALKDLLEELAGYGGDEQWRGDWYPVTLIRYDYFESYMDEMLEDCGELPKDLPSYLSITVDYDALKMDYSTVEIDGIEYYYR